MLICSKVNSTAQKWFSFVRFCTSFWVTTRWPLFFHCLRCSFVFLFSLPLFLIWLFIFIWDGFCAYLQRAGYVFSKIWRCVLGIHLHVAFVLSLFLVCLVAHWQATGLAHHFADHFSISLPPFKPLRFFTIEHKLVGPNVWKFDYFAAHEAPW